MNEVLTAEDQLYFKKWIELNLSSISWEGRYLEEFNQFWELLFQENTKIEEQFLVINNVLSTLTEGPLISWIKWVKEKLICYSFIYKGQNVSEISGFAQLEYSETSTILRDFFVERFPHQEEKINEIFQVGNALSDNLNCSFEDLVENLKINDSIRGSLENEILTGLEVTLYSEWGKLSNFFTKDKKQQFNLKKKSNSPFSGQRIRFFSELIILFFIGALLILSIKLVNNVYEDYLLKNISLFEPNFLKLEKNLVFKSDNKVDKKDISVSLDEVEKLEKIESKKVFKDSQTTSRFEVESDVVLTSVDALPKDINVADREQSTYEEVKKGGYRNSRYGRRKAYRVMMTSVDPKQTRKKLITLLNDYNVKQVDNVKPGTQIPGGIYFNLFIPRVYLKDFLSKVNLIQEATILESKTSRGGPAGSDKIFIWIKSI